MKWLFAICLLLTCFVTSAQPPAFVNFRVINLSRFLHLKSLLIIGTGPSSTRIALTGIGQNLAGRLGERGIIAEFQFAGSATSGELPEIDQLTAHKYDAVLYMLPLGEAIFGKREGRKPQTGQGADYGKSRNAIAYTRIAFNQRFKFNLYSLNEKRTIAAEAIVQIWCDPGKSKSLKNVSASLLESFRNQYFFKTDTLQ